MIMTVVALLAPMELDDASPPGRQTGSSSDAHADAPGLAENASEHKIVHGQ
jgi:hypothetical protein